MSLPQDTPEGPTEAKNEPELSVETNTVAALRNGDYARVIALVEQTPTLPSRMINMAFSAMIGLGRSVDSAAVEALQICNRHDITPSVALHNNILGAFSKHGPPEAVLAWIARMEHTGINIERIARNLQLKAHASMGPNGVNLAVTLLTSMMREVNGMVTPDAVSYNTVIVALAHAHQPEKAEAVLNGMLDTGLVKPSAHSYCAVIGGFAITGAAEEAEKWLERMLASGVQPDAVAFNSVLLAYAKAHNVEGAQRVLNHFDKRSMDECPNAKLDVVSFNTLIHACAKAGRTDQAEKAFASMIAHGLSPDRVTYSSVIDAHAHVGNPSKAQEWLDRMEKHGIAADAVSYNTVCAAHARRGDAAAALACLKQMDSEGVVASATTHAIMINALVKSGNTEQAETSLRQLLDAGERIEASCFNAIISLHAKAGCPERAETLLKLMLESKVAPSLVSFNSLAAAYAKIGDVPATETTLQFATQQGFTLDRYSYGALLQASFRASSAGGVAEQDAARKRGVEHAVALMRSGITLNEFLVTSCKRALGDDRLFDQLCTEHKVKLELDACDGSGRQRRTSNDSVGSRERRSSGETGASSGRSRRWSTGDDPRRESSGRSRRWSGDVDPRRERGVASRAEHGDWRARTVAQERDEPVRRPLRSAAAPSAQPSQAPNIAVAGWSEAAQQATLIEPAQKMEGGAADGDTADGGGWKLTRSRSSRTTRHAIQSAAAGGAPKASNSRVGSCSAGVERGIVKLPGKPKPPQSARLPQAAGEVRVRITRSSHQEESGEGLSPNSPKRLGSGGSLRRSKSEQARLQALAEGVALDVAAATAAEVMPPKSPKREPSLRRSAGSQLALDLCTGATIF